ncbi:purine-nucleoside phosphorylase [symbiont of Argiope bruennichi]|uniref:purine-nucleoside phosphorylase n=1 Tax=symbiont of Argiope bruennichi TaxID=2810479 RepID=UPI003DA39ACC
MYKIPTPHIEARKEDFAEVVLMPGDPVRAKKIAEKYLVNVKQINSVRGMLGFTGYYNGKRVSVMGHGMGFGSCGIYFYELFHFYDVKKIIRIGSCGGLNKDMKLGDVVLCKSAFTNSNVGQLYNKWPHESVELHGELYNMAKQIPNIKECNVLSSELFYSKNFDLNHWSSKCDVIEMEVFLLLLIAKDLNKDAVGILTVVDNLVTEELWDSDSRASRVDDMVKAALSLV